MLREAALPWPRVSAFIAAAIGLHFPRERWADLHRGLAGAAEELGFGDVAACTRWLLEERVTREELQVIASHLTIGETYFFREERTFAVLREQILPAIIASRRAGERRLRLWSAACCTGEEAYSLAILVRQLLPDLADWRVSILATDINPRFLQRAATGAFSEWSFRGTGSGLRQRYFQKRADGRFAVAPEIREMVTFAPLNLVEDVYPSLATDTNAMDVVFCRNVLMYFTPEQVRNVAVKLHHSVMDGGWLAVSPSEASQAIFPEFATRNFPGAILFQKTRAGDRVAVEPAAHPWTFPGSIPAAHTRPAGPVAWPVARPREEPVRPSPRPSPLRTATELFAEGRYADVAEALLDALARAPAEPGSYSLLARALANQGRLAEARRWCDRWLEAERMEPAAHYLRAVVLLEQGEPDEARAALQRAVYLQPDFVLAHFTLGNVARARGTPREAGRHYRNALALLARCQPDDVLPHSDGLGAGRLAETITTITSLEAAP